jgi:drug/metabolite transporter (DMT)-like permease
MLSGLCKFFFAGAAFLILYFKGKETQTRAEKKPISASLLLLGIVISSAVIGGVSYALQLTGASHLDASLLYPFITGGSMAFSTLVGIFVFRERPSKKVILGVVLCFVGTLLFL